MDIKGIEYAVSYFPGRIRAAVIRAAQFFGERAMEIHICRGSGSSVRFPKGRSYLGISVLQREIDQIISAATGGSLYAHRDSLREGFISLGGGVRIGVCGQARYEDGELVGISDISSLLVRLPCGECTFTDDLVSAFTECERGLLIFAPPSGGKTTALRSLVKRLSENGIGRIALIDERCEIATDEFSALDVDVFRGYRRAQGMQIALRVMSAEILAIDEIGCESESRELLASFLGGTRLIATAHARNSDELKKRKNLAPIFELDAFDICVGIYITERGFECKKERL